MYRNAIINFLKHEGLDSAKKVAEFFNVANSTAWYMSQPHYSPSNKQKERIMLKTGLSWGEFIDLYGDPIEKTEDEKREERNYKSAYEATAKELESCKAMLALKQDQRVSMPDIDFNKLKIEFFDYLISKMVNV